MGLSRGGGPVGMAPGEGPVERGFHAIGPMHGIRTQIDLGRDDSPVPIGAAHAGIPLAGSKTLT